MDNATLAALSDPLRGRCPPPFYDVSQFGFDGCMSYLTSAESLANIYSC